jgi:hypothetical protein
MITDVDRGTGLRRFAPGEAVVRREILLGEVWFAFPTICVKDSADLLALYIPTDRPFGFPQAGTFPAGQHPWLGHRERWSGHGKLMLHRPGEAHSIDVFTRPRVGLWWPADADRYVWKDVEQFEQRIAEGRYPGMTEAIRAEGNRIANLLDAGQRWWDEERRDGY